MPPKRMMTMSSRSGVIEFILSLTSMVASSGRTDSAHYQALVPCPGQSLT
jgi:hypothetical protein